ncbi:uncharacterized protein LOC121418531 isoform X3 [Lytechinus variegatus]|uniref:uncharacterized protein LOC121418531 isoform X3 n=1 Tax=Lytechinus variegatus TaxID=7654 RepID=UPI001BB14AE3|nr:uncharacterized protein LOC121418531 isoform X3 [Lytechinus variegatus]
METCSIFRNSSALKTVLALFLQTCHFLGTVKCIGVYLPDLKRTLGLSSTDIGLAIGLFEALSFAPGPVIAYIYRRTHGVFRRCLLVTGAIFAAGGLLLVSIVTNGKELAVCLSIAGLGSSFLSISLIIILSDQSGEAFAVFYGIGKSGYAFGIALVPLTADYLMEIYGWRGSLMIIGGIMAHLIPFVLMVDLNVEGVVHHEDGYFNSDDKESVDQLDRPEKEALICTASIHEETSNNGEEVTPKESTTGERITGVPNVLDILDKGYKGRRLKQCSEIYASGCRILTDSIYNQDRWMILLMLITLVFYMVDAGWYAYLIPRAIALGLPTYQVLCLPYAAAVGAFIGRFLGGFLEKSKLLTGQSWFLFLTLLNILSLLWDIFAPKFAFMIVTSFISAFTIAERNLLLLVICKDRAPRSQFPMILASYEIFCGIGLFLGSLLCDSPDGRQG